MRIRVVHRRLGVLYGDLLLKQNGLATIKLDAFERAATVSTRYISNAVGDVEDEAQTQRRAS